MDAIVYATTCEVICVAYKTDDGTTYSHPLLSMNDREQFTKKYLSWVAAGAIFHAWNAPFEMNILAYNFCVIVEPRQWRCTMVQAKHMGLPGALANAADIIGGQAKDKDGRALMLKMCKPLPNGAWLEDKLSIDRLMAYCMQDVEAEYAVGQELPPMPPSEQELWEEDRRMNTHGVRIDVRFAEEAEKLRADVVEDINVRLTLDTDGDVPDVTLVSRMSKWVAGQGYPMNGMDKLSIKNALADPNCPADVKRVLEYRAIGGKSSLAKLQKIITLCDEQGYTHEFLAFHAASTGRWGGRGIQLHNFPRPDLKPARIEELITQIRDGNALPSIDILRDLPSCLRGAIIPDSDCECFIVTDYAAIEARLVGWVSGCTKLVTMFSEYDEGIGDEPYMIAARLIFRDPSLKDKSTSPNERNVGKFGILGCGYGMGAGKASTTMIAWGVKNVTDTLANQVVHQYYRAEYPEVVQAWKNLENAWRSAFNNPGHGYTAHKCVFIRSGKWMRIRLPSGSVLSYYQPRIVENQLEYYGEGLSGSLTIEKMYGGRIMENICQRLGRDLMKDAILRLKKRLIRTAFHVHDEIVNCVEKGHAKRDQASIIQVINSGPKWAEGLPINCESHIQTRYGK